MPHTEVYRTTALEQHGGHLLDRIVKSLTDTFAVTEGLQAQDEATQFEAFVAQAVLKAHFDDDFSPLDFVIGAGGDLGVDIAGILINGDLLLDAADVKQAVAKSRKLDVKFVLIQAKRSQNFEASVFTELGDNLHHLFVETVVAYPANDDVLNLKKAIDAVFEDISKISHNLPEIVVNYATTGNVGDTLLAQKAAAAARRLDETNYFSKVSVEAIGARQLRDLHQAASSAATADFTMDKRLTLPKMPGVTQSFLGVLSAKELVRLLTDIGGGIRKSVFFDNVRDFQDYNPVNLEILNTLQDSVGQNRFAVLNNGITIVSRSLALAGDDFQLKDFQIVNGCQTCHVLFHAKDILTDDIHVSVRLIQSQDEDVISGITAATNRQTAVTDDDLAAQEHFHKDLEALFPTFAPAERLYYERRSKQYADMLEVERTRIVTKAQATKSFASMFLDEPARAGRYINELKEDRKADLFNPTQNTLAYYTSSAAFYRIEWMLRNKRIPREYAPARYQLLMGIKLHVLGDGRLPQGDRKSKAACDKLLNLIWSAEELESLVKDLLSLVDATVEDETPGVALNRDSVRTKAFTEGFKARVLAGRPSSSTN